MNVTLEQWQALLAVVDQGGYAKAAEHLGKSQSAVSYARARRESQRKGRLFKLEGRKASLVNIGSVQAAKIIAGRTHYAPAKLGLEALTRNVSAEMTPLGIRVNCVHPGFIATSMTEWILNSPEILPEILKQISVGRPGQPKEIGTVAAFFASDEASYLTGQSIHVDGGWVFK